MRKLKKFFIWSLYGNRTCRFFRHKLFSPIIIALCSLYLYGYRFSREDIDFFQNHSDLADHFLIVALGVQTFTIIMIAIGNWVDHKWTQNREGLKDDLVKMSAKLVKVKRDRFKNNASKLKDNIFTKITQPSDQINLLLMELNELLRNRFNLSENEVCITILEIDQASKELDFRYSTQQGRNHTDAKVFLEKQSTAKLCLEQGEPIFHPDKKKAAEKGTYYLSERDKRHNNGTGSIYCFPSITKTPKKLVSYVISVVTYNRHMVFLGDKEETDAIKEILNDICRRIDLELTLRCIKEWDTEREKI